MVGSHELTTNPIARAGMISYIMLKLKNDVECERIKPLLVMGMIPLCSEQYRRLFGTTRIAGLGVDKISHIQGSESNYCVCLFGGRYFKIPLTTPSGRPYSAAEMELQFEAVCKEGEGEVKAGEEDLPALTTLGREEWALAREEFFQDGLNKASLETIEKVIAKSKPSQFAVSEDHDFYRLLSLWCLIRALHLR